MTNRLNGYVIKINKMPNFLRPFLLTKLFCSQVKYANTSGVKLIEVSNNKAVLTLANKKRIQNHIGGVHAIAAALLAESATGIVFGINVPDTCVPLIKTIHIDYQRRMQGALKAVATITNEQIKQVIEQPKGDLMVNVEITDESNEQPIICQMQWAWVSKKR